MKIGKVDQRKRIFELIVKMIFFILKNSNLTFLKFPKINYSKFFLSFEKFFYNIIQEQIYDISGDGINIVQNKVKDIAFSLYYGFDPRKLPPGNKNLINTLKSLSQDTSIVIMKPDKGNGIVILNMDDYVKKTEVILEYHSKFKIITEDWFKTTIKHEDKVIRFLQKLKKDKIIDDPLYQQLYPSGSRPGVLYGLRKIHKEGVPMQPILSSIGTCGYNIAKFLVPFLQPLTKKEYTVKDSFSFVDEITSLTTNSHITMASFGIKSLFTNVPFSLPPRD